MSKHTPNKKLPFHVTSKHGDVLAAFAFEDDAKYYAEHRANTTFSTPITTFKVVDMSKPTKAPNGRLVGEVWYEYESKRVGDWNKP